MGWMLEAAGIPAAGLRGRLRANGLVGVWLYTLRAWQDDASADLAGTMAALDKALDQAERFSAMFGLDTEGSMRTAADAEVMEGVVDLPDEPLPEGEPDVPPLDRAAPTAAAGRAATFPGLAICPAIEGGWLLVRFLAWGTPPPGPLPQGDGESARAASPANDATSMSHLPFDDMTVRCSRVAPSRVSQTVRR